MAAVERAFGVVGYDPDAVQVAVRRYTVAKGTSSLQPHLDDVTMFAEPVLSLVLRGDGGGGLHLWPAGRRPEAGEAFAVHERPGTAVCLEGAARYEFVHSVPPVEGPRLSMTWRWFRPEYLQMLIKRANPRVAVAT